MTFRSIPTHYTNIIRQSKLRTRLIIVFLLISLIPSLVLTLVANNVYEESITSKAAKTTQQTLDLLNNNVMLILEEYSKYISDISISEEVQSYLFERRENATALSPKLKDIEKFSYSSDLRDTVVFDVDGNIVYSKGWVGLDTDRIPGILSATDRTSPKDYVSFYEHPYGSDCIVICRKIYDNHYTKTHVGYIALFFTAKALDDQAFPVTHLGGESSMFLLNSDGIIVAAQDKNHYRETGNVESIFSAVENSNKIGNYVVNVPDADNLVLCAHNEKYNLYLCSVIPNSVLNTEIQQTKHLILSITSILLLVCLVISLLMYSSVMHPVSKIISVCKKRELDDAVHLVNDSSPDELGFLSRTIDAMILKDVQSMEEIQLRDKQKRELEIQVLRDQLNPHFLFNTLNTFKWIAGLNGLDILSDGIASLAGLLRSTLEKKDEMVTVRDEIATLKSYCTILSLRYAGQFNISYFLEGPALDCQIPRFLLQPLVENSILHGIQGSDTLLNISVSCSVINNLLCISITDDGIGFIVDHVVDKGTSLFTGIGLSNVDNRLRLYYGEQCRLIINSTPGNGTICRITIPLAN